MANDDGLIKIGTQVDISGLRSGMEEAAGVARSSSQNMASAMEAARVAAANLAQAQAELGRSAAQGFGPAQAVIAEYQSALAAANAQVTALSSSSKELAISQEAVALSTRNVTSNYYAAMGASELFRGRIPIRAMERFVATSSTVGTVLQYAFPVIGAIALTEVLVQAGEKLGKFIEDARELSAETGAGWLDAAIGQVDGLADAARQAQDEVMNLAQDMDKLAKERQQETFREIDRTQGPAAAMRAEADALDQQLTKNRKLLEVLQAQRDVEQQQVEQAKAQSASMTDGPEGSVFAGIASSQDALKAAQSLEQTKAQIRDLDQTDANIVQRITDLHAEAADQRHWISPAMREAQEAARKYGEQVRSMSRETTTLINRETEEEMKSWHKLDELVKKMTRPIDIELDPGVDAAIDKAVDDYTKLGDAQVEASEIAQKAADAQREASIRAQESIHAIAPLAAAHEIAAQHAREYTEALAKLTAQLEVQKQAGKDAEAAQTQNQIAQLQGNRAVQQIQDQSLIQQQIAKPWMSAFDQINQGWLTVQNRMLFTTRNIGLEFAKMGQGIVISGLDAAEKWALGWAEKELLAVVLHHTTNAQKTASDQASNATALASGAATNVALAESYAAVAAAAAAASVAAIPVTGWAMAPGVGAATYAETSAYAAMAAFETGTGYVPRDGIAQLHEGEAVIPAPTMEELRGSKGGGDVTINHTSNIHAVTDERILAAIRRNPHEIAGALKRHLRQAGKI